MKKVVATREVPAGRIVCGKDAKGNNVVHFVYKKKA